MRRRAFFIALIFLAISIVWWAQDRSGHDHYVFLHVVESKNKAMAYLPVDEYPLEVSFHCENQALWTTQGAPHVAPVLVLFEMDTLGLRLHQTLASLDPEQSLQLSEPLSFCHPQGHEIIDNDERLLRHDLLLRKVNKDGSVVLHWQDEEFELAPGQGWSVGMIAPGIEPMVALPHTEWEERLRAAWEEGASASRLTIFNYGLWSRQDLSVGDRS